VFKHFISEYEKGRTPNPDILCNKYIKFDKFLEYAIKEFKADKIAMGHYAKIENNQLMRAKDTNKDQTYFLSQLSSKQISKVLFPLANLTKPEVRTIAIDQGLITANKKDSTGICFIGERDFAQFLQNYIPNQPGDIVSVVTNKKVGSHVGVMYYTIGQRKGLNLGGMKEPHFVVGHDIAKKILYVAPLSQPIYLESDKLEAIKLNLNTSNYNLKNISAKFRYRQVDIPVEVVFDLKASKAIVTYSQKASAVTPGQEIVFYDGQKCIGGAVIDKVYLSNKIKQFL
jgi:tRNA-specific 2-thiouridylase